MTLTMASAFPCTSHVTPSFLHAITTLLSFISGIHQDGLPPASADLAPGSCESDPLVVGTAHPSFILYCIFLFYFLGSTNRYLQSSSLLTCTLPVSQH